MSETHPKPVRQFVEGIEALFPNAEITLERGGKTSGVWWIDIAAPQAYVVVNWSQAKGFSLEEVTDEELVYGSLPAERYQTVDIALKRMTQLLAEETAAG